MALLLALDQGTTSTRAILFDDAGNTVAQAQRELPQIFAATDLVEHDATRIWRDCLAVGAAALERGGVTADKVTALGITNQRETTVLWERANGRPIANAIVWQDRRTADRCERLRGQGLAETVRAKTGLEIDPYFSATKLAWLLDNVAGARRAAERGELAFGTVDAWLVWNLTGGALHATDATNASRTMLFDIHAQRWDAELLELFDIPSALLPEVRDSAGDFGRARAELLGAEIPITSVVGDQQGALVGQAALAPGESKSTYGTGCFTLLNTGSQAVRSKNRLLTTVAYRLGGQTAYALEGSIFVAGAAIQWLRDGLGVIAHADESAALAASLASSEGVYLVPAFTGLGAPYWDPRARGALLGLRRDSTRAHVVRAALEAVCYQTLDLVEAMAADGAERLVTLRVDGGMAKNDWLLQFLADMLDVPVERPVVTETTALGAAFLAGLGSGVYRDLAALAGHWRCERRFEPAIAPSRREGLVAGWREAVARVRVAPPVGK